MCFYPELTGTWHGRAHTLQPPEPDTGADGGHTEEPEQDRTQRVMGVSSGGGGGVDGDGGSLMAKTSSSSGSISSSRKGGGGFADTF